MSVNTKTDPVMIINEEDTDLPEQSGNLYADAETVAKSIPRWLLISALLMTMAAVIGFGFSTSIRNFNTSTPIAKINDSLTALLGSASPVFTPISKSTAHQETLAPLPLALALSEKVSNIPQQPIPVQSLIDDQKLAKLETQLAQLTLLVETQNEIIDTQKHSVETQFKTINSQLNALPKLSTKLPAKRPLVVLANKRVFKAKSLAPPFKLVSIDHWGNETHAVVRYQGQLHTLMPGNSLLNWTVDGLNETEDGVYVLSSRGQRSLLTQDYTSGH
jgi:hypothetical protein